MARPRRIERRDWCHAMGDAVVVDESGIERIGQCETAKRTACPEPCRRTGEIVNRGCTADDVVAIDEQNQREIDAVPMDAFRSRAARCLRACLDPKLMRLDAPRLDRRQEAATQSVAETQDREHGR